MERGVYFDAWFGRQHCYHPSLPPRRLRMVEQLAEYRATSLVWAALGGGSISLPYLEEEVAGEIPSRFRIYGFVNDAEFIAACQAAGIKVFGIVFEVQGWEFPVELNEREDTVLAINELQGVGGRAFLGLREFSQDRYPKLWKSFESYFPGGLTNSAGMRVTDILEECVSRDIYGQALHSTWVEVPGRDAYCYLMDRNNPVWREYLKAVIRIQIDAGVAGILLDEADLPLFSTRYGGCFCRDCMNGFRDYLATLGDGLPDELADTDLRAFHYGEWLLARGYDFKSNREATPLYWHYIRYQRAAVAKHFRELVDYARQYAAERGREILVSANFSLAPHTYAFQPLVDMIATESVTGYRQPAWCRYAAGFAAGRPVLVVEQPFGSVVPELVEALKLGRSYDRFRMMMFEAAALGINMTLPFGAWMGPVIEDTFDPPHALAMEVQGFLGDHEDLFGHETWSETAVCYSIPSHHELAEERGAEALKDSAFWRLARWLSDTGQPYDVLIAADDGVACDLDGSRSLTQYRTIIVPDCRVLSAGQLAVLESFVEGGGRLLVVGEVGRNLGSDLLRPLLDSARTRRIASTGVELSDLADGPQVRLDSPSDIAVHIQRSPAGPSIHLIRYDYDEASDSVPPLLNLHLDVRLSEAFRGAVVHAPGQSATSVSLEASGEIHRLWLRDVGIYTVVTLTK